MPTFAERLQHGWNAFRNNKDPTLVPTATFYGGNSYRPDRLRMRRGNERSIVNAIYNKIATDVSSVDIQHVLTDENGLFVEVIKSGLNNVFCTEANLDQTGRAFIRDIVISMFDEGVVAAVPIDTSVKPRMNSPFDILTMRTGRITQWYPNAIRVEVYNEKIGKRQEIVVPKRFAAIMENPFYSVMNEPNSTLQRLIRKLNLLDSIDEQSSAGKLDLIIQLPYTIRSEARKKQAENRRKDIEEQLNGTKYGIAYTDGTERITQLNRPIDNNLMKQIEYLTETLMGQLGITNEILNCTANEETMANYYARIVEPILTTIAEEMRRKFLSKTARDAGESIMFFRDTFKLVPISNMAEIAAKLTSSEILAPNEIRRAIGFKPSDDPKANELRNRNINPIKQDSNNPFEGINFDMQRPLKQIDSQEEIQNE